MKKTIAALIALVMLLAGLVPAGLAEIEEAAPAEIFAAEAALPAQEAAPSQEDRQRGGLYFFTMMLFNYLWTPLFFRLNAYFPALIDIVVMIVLTIAVLPYLRKSTRLGHLLTAVCLIWLFYAFYLTLGVVILNKTSIH